MNTKKELLNKMFEDDFVQFYKHKELPSKEELENNDSIFLAGPTSRNQILEANWRCEAVEFLRKNGFKGFIYVPEHNNKQKEDDFTDKSFIHNWESSRLFSSKKILFWIPRDKGELIGINTNLELGIFIGKALCAENFVINNNFKK